MMKKYISMAVAATVAVAALGTSCKKEKEDKTPLLLGLAALSSKTPTPVSVSFAVQGDSQSTFSCNSTITVNGITLTPNDLRFYISNVRMVRADGTEIPVTLTQDATWQTSSAALLDFENATGTCPAATGTAATNTVVSGIAEDKGPYAGVAFDLGLPQSVNAIGSTTLGSHVDDPTLAAPLNIGVLYWSWTGGHKFTKIELLNSAASVTTLLHIGSTGCTTYSAATGSVYNCAKAYLGGIKVTKAAGSMDLSAEKVVLDLPTLLSGYDTTNGTTGGSCMPGDGKSGCQRILTNLGYVGTVGGAAATYTGQSTAGANGFVIR